MSIIIHILSNNQRLKECIKFDIKSDQAALTSLALIGLGKIIGFERGVMQQDFVVKTKIRVHVSDMFESINLLIIMFFHYF